MPIFARWRRKEGIWYRAWQVAKRLSPYDIDAIGEDLCIGQGGGAEGRAKCRAKR